MKQQVRKVLRLWHRWFGLLASLWLLLLALTGSILVFYDEIDSALNADLHSVTPQESRLQESDWIQAALDSQPGTYAGFVILPTVPEDTAMVSLGAIPGEGNPQADGLNVYVNPYTGEIAGSRRSGEISLDRRHIMDFIYELHLDLMLGEVMIWFLGLVSLLWIIDHLVSLFISFPVLRKWADSFRIRYQAGGYKRLFDSHRAGGLWLFPVTLMFAVSGLYFNWYESVTHALEEITPLTPRYIFTLPDLDDYSLQPAVNMPQALEIAREQSDQAQLDIARYLPQKAAYEIRAFDPRDIDPYGRRMIVVSSQTGEVLSDLHVLDGGWGNVLTAWQYPLHSGKAFGWLGRLIVFFSGLVIAWLCFSGYRIWWRKRRARLA
jgi:uncharacterized iron-regulated membrane protein